MFLTRSLLLRPDVCFHFHPFLILKEFFLLLNLKYIILALGPEYHIRLLIFFIRPEALLLSILRKSSKYLFCPFNIFYPQKSFIIYVEQSWSLP